MMLPMTLHGVIVAVSIPSNFDDLSADTYVGTTKEELDSNSLRSNSKNKPWGLLNATLGSDIVIRLGIIGSHLSICQDSRVLMSVRVVIALNMSIPSMSFSDIDGNTATTTETKFRWCRRGTHFWQH